jgi:RND family efflux transporter MFP subunit
VTEPGSIQAIESVQLKAGVSGFLKTPTVELYGARVKKDQVLAKLDVPDREAQVQGCAASVKQAHTRVAQMEAYIAVAKADLRAAKAAVPQAKALENTRKAELKYRQIQLDRMTALSGSSSIEQKLVDEATERREAAHEAEIAAREGVTTAEARVESMEAKVQQAKADAQEAEAQVKVAEAELTKAQVLVDFATIRAPFDGIITDRNFDPGAFVRSAQEGGPPLFTVQRTDWFRIVVQVPDQYVPFCDPGKKASVTIDALPGQKLEAKVARISSSEDTDTLTMHVEVDLPNKTGRIKNGMPAKVTITLEESTWLSIPPSCLVDNSEDGKGHVYVVRDGRARLIEVTLGPDNGVDVSILKGLTASDQVVLHPTSGVSDGTPVEVSSIDAPANQFAQSR